MGVPFKRPLKHRIRWPDKVADSSQHYTQEHAESQNHLDWERPQESLVQSLAQNRAKLKITGQNMRPGQTESNSHFSRDRHKQMKTRSVSQGTTIPTE